jgi:hypothetical protein
MKRFLIALCVAGQLSACASTDTMNRLDASKRDCAAGNTQQCANATTWERMASDERKDNAGKVALAVVAIPLIAGLLVLGAAASQPPTYRSSTTCSSWGRSTTCNSWAR